MSSNSYQVGDLLKFSGALGYPSLYHYGVYLGDGAVAHLYARGGKDKMSAEVQVVSLPQFVQLAYAHNVPVLTERVAPQHRLPDGAVVQRALSRVGSKNYHVLFNNCEHFARWCVTGEARSEQVEHLFKK
jgi:HRAS-like suppressor 3